MKDLEVVILAAGRSTRLGRPKQMVRFQGETLLARTVRIALAAEPARVTVVIHEAPALRQVVQDLPIEVVINPRAEAGIGTSIKAAIDPARSLDPAGWLFLTCDQPFVTAAHLVALRKAGTKNPRAIVATGYGHQDHGVPALFPRVYLPDLRSLKDNCGAKALMRRPGSSLEIVPLPEAAFDIDTPVDLRLLLLSE